MSNIMYGLYTCVLYNVHVIQRKYNILDASKETGSKATQKRNN